MDAPEIALMRAILARAISDLASLLNGAALPGGRHGGPLTPRERAKLRVETIDWFLNPEPSPMSLDVVCKALGKDPEVARSRVRRLLCGRLEVVRRKKVGPDELAEIRHALDGGYTVKQVAETHRLDRGSIRRFRIKFRAERAAHSAKVRNRRAAACRLMCERLKSNQGTRPRFGSSRISSAAETLRPTRAPRSR